MGDTILQVLICAINTILSKVSIDTTNPVPQYSYFHMICKTTFCIPLLQKLAKDLLSHPQHICSTERLL